MPLRISFDDVVNPYVVGDDPKTATVFQIREINAGHIEDATAEASKTGKYIPAVYQRELWFRILAGWDRLEERKGVEVPYVVPAARTTKDAATGETRPTTQAEWVHAVSRALPAELQATIRARALVGHTHEEAALGN